MKLAALSDAWRALRAGQAVADPAAWKQGQVGANAIVVLLSVLVALSKDFGYDLQVDDATLAAVGTGLFAFVNWLFTVVSTDKIGITGARAPALAGPAGDRAAGGVASAAAPVAGSAAEPPAADPLRGGRADAAGPTGDSMP